MEGRTYPRSWFRTSSYGDVTERRFTGETEHTLKEENRRYVHKVGSYEQWYPTREEAEEASISRRALVAQRRQEQRVRDLAPQLLNALEAVFPVARLSIEARDQIVALIKEARG